MLLKISAPLAALAALVAVALPAAAQNGNNVEITPMAVFMAEGNFDSGFDDDDFDEDDLEVDEANGLGLIVGFEMGHRFDFEISYSKSETSLEFDDGFLGEIDLPIDLPSIDIDVEYLHVGVALNMGDGAIQPFLLASVGATRLSPNLDFDDETRPSAALGGGVKIFFHDNFGLRLQARVLSTLIEENDDAFCDDDFGCVYYDADTYLYQAELSAGLTFAF